MMVSKTPKRCLAVTVTHNQVGRWVRVIPENRDKFEMGMLEVLSCRGVTCVYSCWCLMYHAVGSPEITASLLDPCSSLAILSASSISIIPKPWKWPRNRVFLTDIRLL